MRDKLIKLGLFVFGFFALVGCNAFPHNDVLIFGTSTKVAVDVSASAASGGTPEITIGYKREEAVWMPLLANGRDAENAPTQNTLYAATGPEGSEKDAYSVFASFGAQLEGKAGSAKVGLAQFFATGLAAQNLARNPIAALSLSVKPEATGVAEAEAASVAVSPGATGGQIIATRESASAEILFECALLHGSSVYSTPPAIVGNNALESAFDSRLKAARSSLDYRALITDFVGFEASALSEAASKCP